MKYILNETPVKTTNGFMINNLNIDLDINEKELSNYEIDYEYKEEIKDNFSSKIGINHSKYRLIDINVDKDSDININSNLKTNYLVSEININLRENTNSNIIIRFDNEGYNNLKLNVNALENSVSNITVINNLSKDSISFVSFENDIKNSSDITINFIDLGGKIRVSNYYSSLDNYSTNNLNNIHIGKSNDRIDMNYHMNMKGIKSNGNIEVTGALFDESYKTFKGVIDFKEGSSRSVGYENENTILFSNKSISRSLPMLLCHEEDVNGTHSVSTGKIDENKLFYLMSKGLSKNESEKLIMYANFNKILNNISIKEEIIDLIEKKMDIL